MPATKNVLTAALVYRRYVMAKKIISLITGILFSISLVVVGYFTLILAIALAFGNKGDLLGFMPFLLWGSALIAFVGSCLVFKFPKVTGILSSIPAALVIITFIIIITSGLAFNPVAILIYLVPLALAIVSIVLAFLSKPSVPTPYVVGPVANAGQPTPTQPQSIGSTTQTISSQGINISVNLKTPPKASAATPKTKKCAYCDSTVDASENKCPNCGGKLV